MSDHYDRVSQGGEGRIVRVTPERQREMLIEACREGRADIATQQGWDLARSVPPDDTTAQDERERMLRQAWKANIEELAQTYGDAARAVVAKIVVEAEHDESCATPDGWRDTKLVKAILAARDDLALRTPQDVLDSDGETVTTAHSVSERDGEVVVEPPIRPGRTIYLDRKAFTVQGIEIADAGLRDLPVARVPDDFEIWLEQPNEDVLVGDKPIPLLGGERFYTTPKNISAGLDSDGERERS